jgi:hypothetical protein
VAKLLVIVFVNYKTTYVNNLKNQKLVTLTEYIFTGNYYVLLIITFKSIYYLRKYFKNDTDSIFFRPALNQASQTIN